VLGINKDAYTAPFGEARTGKGTGKL
jgi:hypothetical protein